MTIENEAPAGETPPELSEVEQQAIELGWQPKEDFESDPKNEGKKWRSAEDFMDRKPLFDKIDSQSRELKDVKRALQSLANQNRKIEEFAYNRALAELKAQKMQALEEGEHAVVMQIDDRINDLNAQLIQSTNVQQSPQPTEAFAKWVENNDWYVKDKEMRNVADGIGLSLAREGVPPEELMRQVSEKIKKAFPDKFQRSRVPPNPEGSGSRRGNGSGSTAEALLTPSEQRIMNTIVQTGALSKAEYMKQFAAVNPERFKGVKL
jgi:hypothetical protein